MFIVYESKLKVNNKCFIFKISQKNLSNYNITLYVINELMINKKIP